MTSLSENDNKNEINIDLKQCSIDKEPSLVQTDDSQLPKPELTINNSTDSDQNGQSNNSTFETEEKNIINDDPSPLIIGTDEEQQKEVTVNKDEEENRTKKPFNSKVKYSSTPYHRSPYYTNGHPYGSSTYYYYSQLSVEKPAPLMFMSGQQQPPPPPPPSSPSLKENGNSTNVSPQNLPPRLRQTSSTENDSNLQVSSTAPQTSPQPATATNGRRHRSILPRGSCNYYSPHPPPPLMATPPGVLFSYPPAAHQTGHIAYNIRPPNELELLAFQQQLMNLQPPLIWPPPSQDHPHFPSYSMNGLPPPPAYIFNNSTMMQPANSFLNPEAAEWLPSRTDNDSSSSSDNNILIDDEINFPPLNSTTQTITNVKDHIEESSEQTDTSSEIISTNNDNPLLTDESNSKIEPTITPSSSQDDHNNKSLSSPTKITPMTYSTIILQTSENNKSTNNNTQNQRRQQQTINHTHHQLPPRDRTVKQSAQQQQQQRTQISSSNFNSRRRPPVNNNNNNNRNNSRNLIVSSETNSLPKQQSEISDDWIEVKSKKTKKFDRVINENTSEKLILDEQIHKSLSPPLSLSSTEEHTTTTFTSEDDFDEKDTNDIVIIMDKNTTNDFNQIILDDIHRRLDNNERLLIIMRGCPGSGKSTLAKSLNHGYDGIVLSADDYFIDNHLDQYIFDGNKLDDAHRYNRRRASDALKRNISPAIIDNTNTQAWEMKPYVAMAKEAGYDILLIEPQTPWRYKARELFKRTLHNLPLRRIKDMLNRFEHNITVQSLIDQIPLPTKPNSFPLKSPVEQQIVIQDNEIIDPILTSKKVYGIIDDFLILNDVRLCINDMILFLTSNFYQTTTTNTSQSSTPLSVSFHDFSLISTSTTTSTPSTPHSRFRRPLTRFSSTTSQDHSFNTEHILRLPTTTTTFSRCIETDILTPPLSTESSIIGKKRRKNKNKSQQSNEILLNTNNNNNNNNMINEEGNYFQQQRQTYNVFLPENCSDFVVVDKQNDNDWIDNVNRNFGIQINSLRDHSPIIPHQQKQLSNTKNCELINIIHTELTKPSVHHPSISVKHIAIQCSSEDFIYQINHSDLILIGHVSSNKQPILTSSIPPPPGYNECGTQVDLNDNTIDSLIKIYSNRLSFETIRQFYEVCHFDIQWAQTQIDEYLEHIHEITRIPTLSQLSLNTLNQWNDQIKSTDPLFDTKSIGDLLQDTNDDEIFEDLTLDNNNPIELIDTNQLNISERIVNSVEELYGELPNKNFLSSNTNEFLLPFDDDLSISIYQALQRYLTKSNQNNLSTTKPVIKKKKKNNNNNQRWISPSQNQSKLDGDIPSLREIINEEQQAAKCEKPKQKRQLDYATEHKLQELERHFPSFDSELLYDMFRENEFNYDITFICISTMLDEHALIPTIPKTHPLRSISTTKINVEPVLECYDILRRDALLHAQQRKEFYTKADQANRHGMSGVASFYIHRASEETQLMKDANRAACERLSPWRLAQFHQTHRLDLHGLHSDEALHLFKQIEQEFNEGNRRTTPKSIEIITGYGKNSVYGGSQGRIRSVILTYLQQRSYKYSEPNKGVILLQLTNARN